MQFSSVRNQSPKAGLSKRDKHKSMVTTSQAQKNNHLLHNTAIGNNGQGEFFDHPQPNSQSQVVMDKRKEQYLQRLGIASKWL